jgi:hypothetical protein
MPAIEESLEFVAVRNLKLLSNMLSMPCVYRKEEVHMDRGTWATLKGSEMGTKKASTSEKQ